MHMAARLTSGGRSDTDWPISSTKALILASRMVFSAALSLAWLLHCSLRVAISLLCCCTVLCSSASPCSHALCSSTNGDSPISTLSLMPGPLLTYSVKWGTHANSLTKQRCSHLMQELQQSCVGLTVCRPVYASMQSCGIIALLSMRAAAAWHSSTLCGTVLLCQQCSMLQLTCVRWCSCCTTFAWLDASCWFSCRSCCSRSSLACMDSWASVRS